MRANYQSLFILTIYFFAFGANVGYSLNYSLFEEICQRVELAQESYLKSNQGNITTDTINKNIGGPVQRPDLLLQHKLLSGIDSLIEINSKSDTIFIYEKGNSASYLAYIWSSKNGFCISGFSKYVVNQKTKTEDLINQYKISSQIGDLLNSFEFRIIQDWNIAIINGLKSNEAIQLCDGDFSDWYLCRVLILNHHVKKVDLFCIDAKADWYEAERRYYKKNSTDSIIADTAIDIEVIRRRALGLPDTPPTSEKDVKNIENVYCSKWPLIAIAIITTLIAASVIIYRKRKK